MSLRLLKPMLGPVLTLACGLAGVPRAEAEAIYSIRDLGPAGDDQNAASNLFGKKLLRVTSAGEVSTLPSPSRPWSDAIPIQGMGNLVFAPGVSSDGRYTAGTVFEQPVPGPYPWVAYYAHDGKAVSLGRPGSPGGFSAAYGVNNAGQVVGSSSGVDGQTTAFLYTPGRGMVGLGTLGGPSSLALGINDSGLVVGQSSLPDGTYYGKPRAFLDGGHGMVDLNTLVSPDSDFLLTSASGVNAAGQIATYGKNSSGTDHILLLTPAAQPVPEPGTVALFGLVMAGLSVRRWGRGVR